MKFGIPVKELPMTEDGELKNSNHLKWFEKRKEREEAER
jgi:hypothetical protein